MIFGVDPCLFLGAVADAEVHALMVALRDRHADRHFLGLLFLVQRLDVGELEQLEPIQPPLRILHHAALEQVAGLERQLAPDDVLVDALVADDFDRAEMRERSRLGAERQHRLLAVAAIVFAGGDLAVGKAVVLQLVHRHLVGRDHELAIAGLPDLQRYPFLQVVEMGRRDVLEAGEIDRLDEHRRAFVNGDGQIDLILLVVQLDVEAGDARVGVAAVGVERLHPLQIGVEARPIEEGFLAPGDFRALAGGERVLQAALIDSLDALEGQAVDLDRAAFLAGD